MAMFFGDEEGGWSRALCGTRSNLTHALLAVLWARPGHGAVGRSPGPDYGPRPRIGGKMRDPRVISSSQVRPCRLPWLREARWGRRNLMLDEFAPRSRRCRLFLVPVSWQRAKASNVVLLHRAPDRNCPKPFMRHVSVPLGSVSIGLLGHSCKLAAGPSPLLGARLPQRSRTPDCPKGRHRQATGHWTKTRLLLDPSTSLPPFSLLTSPRQYHHCP